GVSGPQSEDILPEEIAAWSTVIEGDWLQSTLFRLRNPDQLNENNIDHVLKKVLLASLRPYQERGVQWLWWLYNMRLGGCLADDMGLGKTIQMISLLLLGNWQAELGRFAPSLSFWIAHNSVNKEDKKPDLSLVDMVITTYGTLTRL